MKTKIAPRPLTYRETLLRTNGPRQAAMPRRGEQLAGLHALRAAVHFGAAP